MTTSVSRVTPCPTGFSDHIYKEEHGVKVPLRVWPLKDAKEGAPWLFWIHGGGFMAGKHVIPNAWVIPAFQQYGYHVVSVGYRFTPHVSFPDIATDIQDAYKWCLSNLPKLCGPSKINIRNYVAAGDSAGGTLSTLCGHILSPKPKCIINLYGVVDMTDNHFHRGMTEEEGRSAWGDFLLKRNDTKLREALAERDPSKADVIGPWDWELSPNMTVTELQSFWGLPDFVPSEKDYFRMDMNKLTSLLGTKFKMLFRWDTPEEKEALPEEEFWKILRSWSPLLKLDEGNGKEYPPTFFLHGVVDQVVPVEQSYQMSKKLKELGVEVGEKYCPDGNHCVENKYESPDHPGWQEYIVPCMEFVDRHVQG